MDTARAQDLFRRLRTGSDEERRKVLVLLFATVALLALIGVAVSAVGGLATETGQPIEMRGIPRLSPVMADVAAFVLVGVATVVGGFSFIYLQERIRKATEEDEGLQRFRLPRIVILFATGPLVIIFAMVLVLSVVSSQEQDESYAEQITAALAEVDERIERGEQLDTIEEIERRRDVQRRRPFILMGAVVVLFLAVAIFGTRLLREVPAETEGGSLITEELQRDLAAAVGLAVDDIAAESDSRRAVELCYARVEEVLERHGIPRPLHETPLEYMHGVLDAGPGLPAQPLIDLTGLYEVAKFSTHVVGIDAKRRAIAILEEIHGFLVAQLDDELRDGHPGAPATAG